MKFQPITTDFKLETDVFCLTLALSDSAFFQIKGNSGEVTLYCPKEFMTDTPENQFYVRNIIREVLRKQAKKIFPPLLQKLSKETGLTYNRLTIKRTSSKWGSYSGLGNLNLSLYLLLLDARYIKYVMYHELCHSREMNHGPRFWDLLNSFLDGNARQLSREIHHQVKGWYQSGDIRYQLISNR